jgi:hypothetical protein
MSNLIIRYNDDIRQNIVVIYGMRARESQVDFELTKPAARSGTYLKCIAH